MKINNIIKKLNENPVILKFGQKQHLESLLKGNLYMKEVGYFRELELIQRKKGMGDKYDGFAIAHNQVVTYNGIKLPNNNFVTYGFIGDE
jgi:hypothetical protein